MSYCLQTGSLSANMSWVNFYEYLKVIKCKNSNKGIISIKYNSYILTIWNYPINVKVCISGALVSNSNL